MVGDENFKFIHGRAFVDEVVPLIDAARFAIDIVIFDWRVYPQGHGASVSKFNEAVFRAVGRGVSVRVILNNDALGAFLRANGCEVKRFYPKRLLHAKFMLIDDCTLVCGSHNYTESAFKSNEEVSIAYMYSTNENPASSYFGNLWGL